MTLLPPTRLEARTPRDPVHEAGQSSAHQLIARLRDAAAEMVPFSGTKTLLREAASTIERLDGSARRHAAEVAHLTAELARARSAPHAV
jgi:hypothetical protein